ncbi:MAG: FUSC family protein [Solirubrobacterales bacterium]|nr:FUSC family protein [Solirubrobacterales bacterium]
MRLSRLTDRIDPAAFRVALRTAIFMPACFALASAFLSKSSTPFAAFGAFILLAMVTFAGRPGPRLIAWLTLVVAGCGLIALGTLLSTSAAAVGVVAAGLISFLIFFFGVVNPYVAAARNGAVLLLALPLMIEAPTAAIDDRLAGWLLACAICIPATYLLWRLPWIGDLRRHSSASCAALSALIRDPGSEQLRETSGERVRGLRRRFLSTPHRPTGATGVSAAIAGLVDELGWLHGLITVPGAGIDLDGSNARRLRAATADLMEDAAAALAGGRTDLAGAEVKAALASLVDDSATALEEVGDDGYERAARRLEHEFRLRKVAYATLDVARLVAIATEREKAPGPLGSIWSWVSVRSRSQVKATGRLISEHAALGSTWLRNSVRGAVGIALAVYAADLLSVQNAFWVVLGTLSILRNNALGTRGSIGRALGGTLVGILIGTLLIELIGNSTALLWIALPLSVLFAAYAPRALSFAAGQAGFALLVMVLYNLIEPVGWQVAIIRIQDVAVGCAVSLLVGLMIWPRGAAALISGSLAETLRAGAALIRERALGALAGRPGVHDDVWAGLVGAADRLDAALRQYLDEASGETIDPESLVTLASAGLRLRRVAQGIGLIPVQPWFETPPPGSSPDLERLADQVSEWYREAGDRIERRASPPPALDLDPDLAEDLIRQLGSDRSAGAGAGAGMGRIWLYENLAYLAELSGRYSHAMRDLFRLRTEAAADQSG